MPKCSRCGQRFRWKQIFKANFIFANVICDKCGGREEITFFSRFILTGVTIIPVLFLMNSAYGRENIFLTVAAVPVIFVIGSAIAPFLVRYKPVGS